MLEFAKVLTDFNDLKVVTNDLNIALELQKKPSIQVILIGGTVRNQFECTFGSLGIEFLERISVDKLFLSPNALSVSKGLTTPNEDSGDEACDDEDRNRSIYAVRQYEDWTEDLLPVCEEQ